MTRGKAQSPADAADELPSQEATVKSGSRPKGSGKKLSREALQLMNTVFSDGAKVRVTGVVPAAKAKSHPSASSPEASPVAVRRKGLSAPPHPEGQDKSGLPVNKFEHDDVLVNSDKDPGNKRGAPTAQEADEGHEEQDRKRHKKPKNSYNQRPQPISGNVGEAGASGSMDPGQTANATAATAGFRTGVDAEGVPRPEGSKRSSKSKDRPSGDLGAQVAPNGGISASGPDTSGQPADINGHSKKLRKGKGQMAAAATDDQGAPSNITEDKEPKTDKPRVASRQANAATAPQVAGKAATAVQMAAAPSVHMIGPQNAGAAAATQSPERLRAGHDGAAMGAAAAHASPVISGDALQPNGGPAAGASPVKGERGRQLPATGTTPVKAFLPIPLPRLDEVGAHDRKAIANLQRQLSEVRAMYDDLKATKIQALEKVLAEQVEYAEEQVRNAEQRAQLWQDVAKRAEDKAKEAGSQDTTQTQQLLKEKGHLLLRVAQLELELSLSQQALHDTRAELLQLQTSALGCRAEEGKAKAKEDERPNGDKSDEAECCEGMGADGDPRAHGGAADQEPSPDVTLAGGCCSSAVDAAVATAGGSAGDDSRSLSRGVGMLFPTPLVGTGVQFPSPNVQLSPMQGLDVVPGSGSRSVGHGISTECQNIVRMLPSLRMPSPSIQSHLRRGALLRTSQTEATLGFGLGSEPGVSTECERAVQLLPGLQVRSPSPQSRLALGAVSSTTQAGGLLNVRSGASDLTPTTANGAQGQQLAEGGSGKRRSNGSPIDGICGSGNRKVVVDSTMTDLSHAHNMGAPEAFQVLEKQDQYSFVDLNPASAMKRGCHRGAAVIAGSSAAPGDAHGGIEPGNNGDAANGARVQPAQATIVDAALVAAAAIKSLPPSPGPVRQTHPLAPAGHPREVSPDAAVRPAGVVVQSGSVASNQGSCNLSGLVARAMSQIQDVQHAAGTRASFQPLQAHGDQSPASASKTLPPPAAHAMAAAGADDGMMQAEGSGDVPQDAQRLLNGLSRSPSPRTAKLNLYERMIEWHVDVIATKPLMAYRVTHTTCGMSFELRETELDDEELLEHLGSSDQAMGTPEGGTGPNVAKYFEYSPLNLGIIGDLLPEFLKETLTIPHDQRPQLLEKLDAAVKAARAKKS